MKTYVKLWSLVTLFVAVLSENSSVISELEPLQSTFGSYRGDTPSVDLWSSVQLLCAVIIEPPYDTVRATYVRETWGRRCNALLFVGREEEDIYMPSIKLPSNVQNHAQLVKYLFDYLHKAREYSNIEWFLLAMDNSFVIVENLRNVLLQFDSSKKVAVGFRKKDSKDPDYVDPNIGYVLSRSTLKAVARDGIRRECTDVFSQARKLKFNEVIGPCFQALGVEIVDSRDNMGRHRFLPGELSQFFKKDLLNEQSLQQWLPYYPIQIGPNCCAQDFIATSCKNAEEIYLLDFLAHEFYTHRKSCATESTEQKSKQSRVACLVFTTKYFHSRNVADIKATWGRKCTKLLFVSNVDDKALPSLNAEEDGNSWLKIRMAIAYANQFYLSEVDWILFSDHDSFVFYDNLLSLLEPYDPEEKLAFGCRFKTRKSKSGFLSDSCIRIISKAAIKEFNEEATNIERCQKGTNEKDDIDLSSCLQDLGVKIVDTRDTQGRFTILPHPVQYFSTWDLMDQKLGDWWLNSTFYPASIGQRACCSWGLVALGKIDRNLMYTLDYLSEQFILKDVV